jgi:hypothetical protein
MGKYSGVIDRLPRQLGTDPSYQEKVNAVKEAMRSEPGFKLHASHLAKSYAKIRLEKEDIEEDLSEVNLRLTAVSQLLTDQYEVESTSTVKLEDGTSVGVQLEPNAQVQDRDALRKWAIESGLERSLQLPWQTTNALTKERLLQGLPEPDGVLAHVRAKIVFKRGLGMPEFEPRATDPF